MKHIAIIYILFILVSSTAIAQMPVKYDSQYKTIFAKDLCRLAGTNPNLVLIDVRSAGEYSDTSQYNSLNMGHLRSAINIEIDTIQKDIHVLDPYKNKTLVFYCSHSQRSRRVSKLLSENGFTDFYNLNGGMSKLNQMTEKEFPCKKEWLESNLKYKNLSSSEAIALIKNEPKLIIIDVRPSAMFNSADSLPENNIGHIRKSMNIPYAIFKDRLNELSKYKHSPILIYTESGDGDAARAAVQLTSNGFDNVYHLLAGFDDLSVLNEAWALIENPSSFKIADAKKTLALLKDNKNLSIYDTRSKIEFENKVTGHDSYKNLGNIKNAVNIEEKDFSSYKYPGNKKNPILITGRSEAFKLAEKLGKDGYKNVYILRGLYDLVSAAYNVEGCKDILQYMENHEGIY